MTAVLAAGAAAGLGVLLLVAVLAPPRAQAGSALARLDLARSQNRAEAFAVRLDPRLARGSHWMRMLGQRAAGTLGGLGIELGRLRSDLAMLGRALDTHLATTVLAAIGGFMTPLLLSAVLTVLGVHVNGSVPLILAVAVAAVAAAVPGMAVRSGAAKRRRDFRHVVGSFLDLVAMSLAGGRGVPEALTGASELSDGWAMVRIRNTLIGARLRGETPWAALGELGEELRVDELRDLAAALALVAEDGAKVRDSLSARAGSMRRRELSDSEGKAGESSQSMLVAQLLLCVGFLIFLLYPAMMSVLTPMNVAPVGNGSHSARLRLTTRWKGPVHIMDISPLTVPGFLALELRRRFARARSTSERGASAIEWVIITGILVAIAAAVGLVIYNMVTAQAASIKVPAAPGGGP